MTLKFNKLVQFVNVRVHAKCHEFMSYRGHKLFALFRNGEKSENSVLCP